MLRTFEGGGTRDTSNGKFDYYGFRHPMCEHSFASYMHSHREQSDGSLRDADNWWLGWDREISLKSLVRHVKDLEALHAGLRVFKHRVGDAEYTHYIWKHETPDPEWREVFEEECCNAIEFGGQAYKLEVLKHR